jgi:hypothetical protein
MSYITPPASSGGGGSGNFVQALVDFGFATAQEGDTAMVTVSAAWVTGASTILCNLAGKSTVDHDPEDGIIEGIVAYALNIVPGVSFDIEAYAPQGSFGKYYINATGV